MYDNIGGKLKGLSKAIFFLEAVASIITGIVLMATDDSMAGTGFLIMAGGVLVAWISSWFLYGFGQLIENSDIIAQQYRDKNEKREKAVAQKIEQKQIKRRKEATAMMENPNVSEDEYIDVTCPVCKAELSYTKGELQVPEGLTCPMCDARFFL